MTGNSKVAHIAQPGFRISSHRHTVWFVCCSRVFHRCFIFRNSQFNCTVYRRENVRQVSEIPRTKDENEWVRNENEWRDEIVRKCIKVSLSSVILSLLSPLLYISLFSESFLIFLSDIALTGDYLRRNLYLFRSHSLILTLRKYSAFRFVLYSSQCFPIHFSTNRYQLFRTHRLISLCVCAIIISFPSISPPPHIVGAR